MVIAILAILAAWGDSVVFESAGKAARAVARSGGILAPAILITLVVTLLAGCSGQPQKWTLPEKQAVLSYAEAMANAAGGTVTRTMFVDQTQTFTDAGARATIDIKPVGEPFTDAELDASVDTFHECGLGMTPDDFRSGWGRPLPSEARVFSGAGRLLVTSELIQWQVTPQSFSQLAQRADNTPPCYWPDL